jgi:glycosyltransferase involved in cell wall biosynthesis
MRLAISVILPTHNPRRKFMERVLAALREQTLPTGRWELIVIDNASLDPVAKQYDLSWHPNGKHVLEDNPGLTRARLAGFQRAGGDLAVLVDDDNVLADDYLTEAVHIAAQFPHVGTWSGKVQLEFENPKDLPPTRLRHLLCERHVNKPIWSNDPGHIAATPWGAGMCIRKEVFEKYIEAARQHPRRLELDLQGETLAYGGDTDIAYHGCSVGFGMGVFPQLRVTHLIPESRCSIDYLLRSQEAHAYSEVLHRWVADGYIPSSRSDLRGQLGYWSRWLLSDNLDRTVMEARQRGLAKARQHLGKRTESSSN